jgi:hypothetical protein
MHEQIKNILPKERDVSGKVSNEQYNINYYYNIAIQQVEAKIPEIIECVYADLSNKLLNEKTLQHKYAKLNKKHAKYIREVELVKGYNWAINRLRVILKDRNLLTPNQDK